MSRIAYVNGRYLPKRLAAVNVEDRGLQFGDGVYEVVTVQDGRFVDEDLHLDRLERSLREIRIPMPMPRGSLRQVLAEVVRRNRVRHGLCYMQVTRGVAPRDHPFPRKPVPPGLMVTAKNLAGYPADVDAWAAKAILYPDQRWERRDIKSTNLLPNVLAKQAAREAGAAEAILYDEATCLVTEGASTSFWIVDEEGALRTRHLSNAILPGCTRAALMQELREAGIPWREEPFTVEQTRRAREAFVTSATSYVRPIVALDGQPVGDGRVGPVTRRLFEIFGRHVKGAARNAA
ncbi:MAG: D-amino-acid transaminase [Acetobacteraceae bacterium]|nr:D-amino-acid transaminase [Acetobacteraceae bacterium]